jgi:hypothetical protein
MLGAITTISRIRQRIKRGVDIEALLLCSTAGTAFARNPQGIETARRLITISRSTVDDWITVGKAIVIARAECMSGGMQ